MGFAWKKNINDNIEIGVWRTMYDVQIQRKSVCKSIGGFA
jgi:hypothetical protein